MTSTYVVVLQLPFQLGNSWEYNPLNMVFVI